MQDTKSIMHSPKEKEKEIMHGGYQIALQESGQKECYAGSNINFRVFCFWTKSNKPTELPPGSNIDTKIFFHSIFFFYSRLNNESKKKPNCSLNHTINIIKINREKTRK
jgi:hypothetical protein